VIEFQIAGGGDGEVVSTLDVELNYLGRKVLEGHKGVL